MNFEENNINVKCVEFQENVCICVEHKAMQL